MTLLKIKSNYHIQPPLHLYFNTFELYNLLGILYLSFTINLQKTKKTP